MSPGALELILCSAPEGVAPYLARQLVEAQLAACVQCLPGVSSTYRWQGKVECSQEALLLIKSKAELREPLFAKLAELHPYAVPEIVALPTEAVHPPYLAWALASLQGPPAGLPPG